MAETLGATQIFQKPIFWQTDIVKNLTFLFLESIFNARFYHGLPRSPQVPLLAPKVGISGVPGLERSPPAVLDS